MEILLEILHRAAIMHENSLPSLPPRTLITMLEPPVYKNINTFS